MSNELQRHLQQLHAELARHPQLDAPTVESLRALLSEIPAAIEQSQSGQSAGASTSSSTDYAGQLHALIAGFETRHPQLTATLNKVATALADLGI